MHSLIRFSSFLFCSFLLALSPLSAQTLAKISGELANADTSFKTISVMVVDGLNLNEITSIPLKVKDGKATFSVNIKDIIPGVYFMGLRQRDLRMVFLGETQEIQITGSCLDFKNAQIAHSPVNETLSVSIRLSDLRQNRTNALSSQLQMAGDPALREQLKAQLLQLDIQRKNSLDSLRNVQPFVASVIALRTYPSFAASGSAEYASEYEYFAFKYFQFVNFGSEDYNHCLPLLMESVKNYAIGMGQIPFSDSKMRNQLLEEVLRNIRQDGPAFKTALLAIALGLKEAGDEDSYVHFAGNYLTLYSNQNPTLENDLRSTLQMYESRRIGGMAPEIAQPTPTGEVFKLSDLRGQVVLIDFWASWCRPCRQENPNVVAAYNKYHAKGFDILGVSLDSNGEAWKKAIAQDKLTWHHVSDLKQWQSEPGRVYGVRSIPHSVLVDREGRIIAKNLRGAELERKLAEIFGE